VLDVGANVGAFTLPFAELVGPAGEVIAFEPQRAIFHMLCANVALNEHYNVKCVRGGLSDVERIVAMPVLDYTKPANFGGVTIEMGGADTASMKKLDSFNLGIVHFIKMDVEGHEREALLGAEQTIAKFGPILYVENDRKEKSPALIAMLQSWGYQLYWHAPTLYQPNNYNRVAENVFEKIVSINMLCMPPQRQLDADPDTLRPIQGPEEWPSLAGVVKPRE